MTQPPPPARPAVSKLLAEVAAVRRHAQAVWWATTILGTAGALLVALVVALLLDRFLVLPGAVRALLLLGVLAAPAVALRRSLRHKPGGSPQELALLIERRFPGLDNSLINSLQLAEARHDGAEPLVAAVTEEAERAVGAIRPRSAIRKTALAAAAVATLVGLGVFVGYGVANGGVAAGLGRVLAPLADNSLTRILAVDPGDSDVLAGSDVAVTATVGGRVPTRGELRVTYPDGRRVTIPMLAASANVPDRLAARLDRLEGDVMYQVVAGDGESPAYRLRVHPPPAIQRITQRVTPPEYIRGKTSETTGGAVQAVAGSTVELRLEASAALRKATLAFETREGKHEQELTLPGGPTASGSFKVERSGRYRIALTSAMGFAAEPVAYDIVAVEDRPPQVEFVEPAVPGGELEVQIDAEVVVEVKAGDDLAVKDIKLVRAPGRAPGSAGAAVDSSAGDAPLATWTMKSQEQAKATGRTALRVAELGLAPDQPIVLQAVASDFKPNSAAGVSRPLTIKLKKPADESLAVAKPARIALDALIAKQRINIASTERLMLAAARSDPTRTCRP